MPPVEMTTAEELRMIADSLAMLMPFQAARLHVLAARVDEMDHGNAVHRATSTVRSTTKLSGTLPSVESSS